MNNEVPLNQVDFDYWLELVIMMPKHVYEQLEEI